MEEQIKLIASRIKGLREILGLPADALAIELGISIDQLLQYENGNTDIPVGVLYKLALKYGVELSSILSGEDPKLHIYSVVRKDKGLYAERRKQYKYESLAYNFAHKKAEPFIVRIDPDTSDSPVEFNSHPGQEFDYVIEGRMKIIIDEHEIILDEGDSIYYDSGHNHAMKAMDNAPVKMLTIIL